METGGPSAVVVVLAVVGASVLLILAAYGGVGWLRQQSQRLVQRAGERIQEYDTRLGQIAGFLQEFIAIDQEPYSTHLDTLQQEASALQAQMQGFLQACHDFEVEINQPDANRLRATLNAPANWFRRWRRSVELRRESDVIAARLADAEARVQQIYDLPWELALQCRQAEKEVFELIRLAQDLQAKGVRGQALQTVLNQLPLLQRALGEIPPAFLQASQEALLASANLEATVRVFERLKRIRPALERYVPQAKAWSQWHQKASLEFGDLKQAGSNLRQAMQRPAPGLEVAPLRDQLDQVAQRAADLSQEMAQPEAGDLKSIAREIGQLGKVLRDTEQQLARARQQSEELAQRMQAVAGDLQHLEAQQAELGQRERFPLALDESRRGLRDLRGRFQALGPIQQPRTPDQVALHLVEIEQLQAGLQAYRESFAQTASQYLALAAVLDQDEVRQGAAWLHQAREAVAQASRFDPRNWPRPDAVQALPGDLAALEEWHAALAPRDPAAPLAEAELAQRLQDTRALAAQHRALRPRVEAALARLEKLRALEQQGQESLSEAFAALQRVGLLTESNDLLNEIAAAEIERLRAEIRALGDELNAPGQGEVEKKLQKIQALGERVNRALNAWLSRLTGANTDLIRQIRSQLEEVEAIARIDGPLVVDARRVLAREEAQSAAPPAAGGAGVAGGLRSMAARVVERGAALQRAPLLANLEATAEIKRKNDLWQTLAAVLQALQENTSPLRAAHQELLQARDEARDRLAAVRQKIPERRAWPPNNQAPLTDGQVLQPVEEKWEALKQQPRPVDQAVYELGRLTQQYRLLTERFRQLLSRAGQDEGRIAELEAQVAGLKQRWQGQAQATPENALLQAGVQQLLSQADAKLAFIQQQYMRGAISYEQVLHNLQLLGDELFSARVALDAQNDIGLNETPPAPAPNAQP